MSAFKFYYSKYSIILSLLIGFSHVSNSQEKLETNPNIILIYADDLGIGDIGCYNPECKIPTPNIDLLAKNGIKFTDAHSPDAICSPSRYGILTGRYSWRTSIKSGNPQPGSQPWIDENRTTIASMLKNEGYNTAAIGKWGLGADWESAAKPERAAYDISEKSIDYSKPVHSGRLAGFTYDDLHLWYGHSYHKTYYPCNLVPGAFEEADGGRWYFENGMSRNGEPEFEKFEMEEAQMHYINRTVEYIDAAGNKNDHPSFNLMDNSPFFVYYAPHIPHWPHVPAEQFQGKTELGYYGDFVYQLDWAVGQIVEALERNNLLDNTIIIFTSDNGPEVQSYNYIKEYAHYSMGNWRGLKRTVWEGGHRIPFIISWRGKELEAESDRLVSQTDILATIADMLEIDILDNNAEDSFSFLDEIFPDKKVQHKRDFNIYHSGSGKFAINKDDWVFINDSTGDEINSEPEWYRELKGIQKHNQPYELYYLKDDPCQLKNKFISHPLKAVELQGLLLEKVHMGRSVPIE